MICTGEIRPKEEKILDSVANQFGYTKYKKMALGQLEKI